MTLSYRDKNKRIPKEFKEAVKTEPLIANKQFYYFTTLDVEVLTSDEVIEKVMEVYKIAKPVSDFFEEAMGK